MITFDNIKFLSTPTKSGRQLVNLDVNLNSVIYDWTVYTPVLNGDELMNYLSMSSKIIQLDIERKELSWVNHPKTEEIRDFMSGNIMTVDISKESVVRPTIPDYVEASLDNYTDTQLQSILNELGTDYWQYPIYSKRILAPIELILDDLGIKMYGWFQLNKLPILKLGTAVHLYCNEILPEHQAIVDQLQGIIVIENRPTQNV